MLVCIWFQGWLLCTGQPTRGSHPWEDSFSFSQQSLIGCISFPGVGCHTILFCVNRSIDIAIVPVLSMQPFLGEIASQQTSWSSGSFFLPPFFCDVPWVIDPGAVMYIHLVWLGFPQCTALCNMFSFVFWNGLHLLYIEASLMRNGSYEI